MKDGVSRVRGRGGREGARRARGGAEGARGRGRLRDQPGAGAAWNENRVIQASFGSAIQRYGLTPCSTLQAEECLSNGNFRQWYRKKRVFGRVSLPSTNRNQAYI